jgi:hypothetical protein
MREIDSERGLRVLGVVKNAVFVTRPLLIFDFCLNYLFRRISEFFIQPTKCRIERLCRQKGR